MLSVSAAYCKIKVSIWDLEGSCVNRHPNRSNQAVWKPSEVFRFLWLRAAEDARGKVHRFVKAMLGTWTWQWCAIWKESLVQQGSGNAMAMARCESTPEGQTGTWRQTSWVFLVWMPSQAAHHWRNQESWRGGRVKTFHVCWIWDNGEIFHWQSVIGY